MVSRFGTGYFGVGDFGTATPIDFTGAVAALGSDSASNFEAWAVLRATGAPEFQAGVTPHFVNRAGPFQGSPDFRSQGRFWAGPVGSARTIPWAILGALAGRLGLSGAALGQVWTPLRPALGRIETGGRVTARARFVANLPTGRVSLAGRMRLSYDWSDQTAPGREPVPDWGGTGEPAGDWQTTPPVTEHWQEAPGTS